MAARKRSYAEREVDLLLVTGLYLKGWSHEAITQHLNSERQYNISRSQVTRDIHSIHERWRETYLTNINELQMRELARIDHLEKEYWRGWEHSMQNSLSVEDVDIKDAQAGDFSYSRKKRVSKAQQRDGDASFLEGIADCIELRCKIFGLFSPKKIDINWREDAARAGIDPEKFVNELTEQFLEHAKSGLDESGEEILPPD